MVLGGDFGLVAFDGWFIGFSELDGGKGAAAAEVVDGGVFGNGEEPGPEEVFGVEAADALVGLAQALLADVLGVCGVGADALDVEAQLAGVACGQGGKCLCVSGHSPEGQIVVVEVGRVLSVFDVFCHVCISGTASSTTPSISRRTSSMMAVASSAEASKTNSSCTWSIIRVR